MKGWVESPIYRLRGLAGSEHSEFCKGLAFGNRGVRRIFGR